MKQWITPQGSYYVGDKLHSCDIEVTERPLLNKEQEAEIAKEELLRIDKESTRPLRAIMVAILNSEKPSKEDEDLLKAKELEAKDKRSKL